MLYFFHTKIQTLSTRIENGNSYSKDFPCLEAAKADAAIFAQKISATQEGRVTVFVYHRDIQVAEISCGNIPTPKPTKKAKKISCEIS